MAADSGAGRWRVIQAVCLIYAAFVMVENVQQVLWVWPTPLTASFGSMGARVAHNGDADGLVAVRGVEPGGAMAVAGVAAGDRLRFDRPYDNVRRMRVGESVGFTRVRGGATSHLRVVTRPSVAAPPTDLDRLGLVYVLATFLAALVGAFIIWRGRAAPGTILLGMGLLTYGLIMPEPQMLVASPVIYPAVLALGIANLTAIPILFYAFASRFYRDNVGPGKPYERVVFLAYAMVQALAGVAGYVVQMNATPLPLIGDGQMAGVITTYVGFAICLGYLILGWRRSTASVQQRYALMLVATAAIIAAQALDSLWGSNENETISVIHYLANATLAGVIAPALFAYSILRHKVLDLGFAVNRTLVYGVVSTILLAGFGLVEWGADHFIPIEGREKNALIDAVVALTVFLTFHRVRDFVEHVIEGLFFRRWQKAEAALRRFVREAAFITEAQDLSAAFVRALGAFTEGAQAAIYLQDGRDYRRETGAVQGAAERLDANLPVLVSLRADPKPAEAPDGALGAALIAPMVNRNEVVGVVLVGPKPTGLGYRPDEIELIGWATRQIALDIHALEVERYAALAADLRRENATLRSLIPQGV